MRLAVFICVFCSELRQRKGSLRNVNQEQALKIEEKEGGVVGRGGGRGGAGVSVKYLISVEMKTLLVKPDSLLIGID